MNIKIHRTSNQKNQIVEISTANTKIILDAGINLEENEVLILSELQEKYGFSGISAVFLSHYKTDHVTMTRGLLDNVPVYSGKLASKIALAAEKYKAKKIFDFAGFYENRVPIIIGEITVTPYQVDEDLYDGYMLMIEGEGESVLYAGDFHANSRRRFEKMVDDLPTRVDVLICEDGAISKDDVNLVTERDIEEQVAELISHKKGPVFVLQSVTDFNRAKTIFQAAKRNKRIFLEDLYMAQIAGAADKVMPNPVGWTNVRAYLTSGYKENNFRYKMFKQQPRVSKVEIETQKFVMCIRTVMKKYMKTLIQCMNVKDGVIINSLPEESFKSPATQEFLNYMHSKGLEVVTLRNSGHADAMALKSLINAVNPKKLVPLDIQNIKWLATEYPKIAIVAVNATKC